MDSLLDKLSPCSFPERALNLRLPTHTLARRDHRVVFCPERDNGTPITDGQSLSGMCTIPRFDRDKSFDTPASDPEYQSIMAGVHQRWKAYKKEFDDAP
jgi:hypothetical protein